MAIHGRPFDRRGKGDYLDKGLQDDGYRGGEGARGDVEGKDGNLPLGGGFQCGAGGDGFEEVCGAGSGNGGQAGLCDFVGLGSKGGEIGGGWVLVG